MLNIDLALEGGGAKGPAHVGALSVLEDNGFRVQRIAGTSAGAIVAGLYSSGKSAAQIRDLMIRTNFDDFKDARLFRRGWDVVRNAGLYQGKAFEKWMENETSGTRLKDTKPALTVFSYDAANGVELRIDASSYPWMTVARAVRMSMGLPFAFRPVVWHDYTCGDVDRACVDGGVTNNYPVDAFDVSGVPRWPTFGLLLQERENEVRRSCFPDDGLGMALALITALRRHQTKSKEEHNVYRTIAIPTGSVGVMDFDMSIVRKQWLVREGEKAAWNFLRDWHARGGFAGYCRRFRR